MRRDFVEKKMGIYILEAGLFCFIIGGCALDGPDFTIGFMLILISCFISSFGYKMFKSGESKLQKMQEINREIKHAREATFRQWVKSSDIKR